MNRTALRLAAMAALQNGGVAPWPTLARDNVFDSRSDPIDDIAENDRLPCIIVRTDEDSVRSEKRVFMGPRTLDLRLQIGVVTAAVDPDTNEAFVGWPETDASLEAFVDLLEFQVHAALFGGGVWAEWFQSRFTARGFASVPLFTAPEMGRVRLAAREISIRFEQFQHDCLPTGVKYDDTAKDGEGNPVIPMTLPPLLLAVFDKIDADGGGDLKTAYAQVRAALESQSLPQDTVYPMLGTVDVVIPEQNPEEGEEPVTDIAFRALGPLPEQE